MKKNSSEYWEQRIAQKVWGTYNSIEERNIRLLEMYQDAARDISNELYALGQKLGKDGVLSRSDMYKQGRLTEIKHKIGKTMEGLGQEAESFAKGSMNAGYRNTYQTTMEQLGGIDYALPNKKAMEEMLDRPWHGSNFSDRLWGNTESLSAVLNDSLVRGIEQGKTTTEMAIEIANAMQSGFNVTHRLVRTETIHFLNCAAIRGYKESGVKKVQYWAAEDERTCDECGDGGYHGRIFDIMKAPILPIHPNCRCTYLPVIEEPGAAAEFVYKNEPVYYDANNDYSIKLQGYPDAVNDGLSRAAKDAAQRGSKDRLEHMHLVDLESGTLVHHETGAEGEVGFQYQKILKTNPDRKFAFVHNHNIISSLSEADLLSPLTNHNMPVQVAVQNDGMKYIAVLKAKKPKGFYPDFYYENELEELNKASRDGKITPMERILKREEIIVNGLIRDFYGGEVIKQDGRRK